MRYLIIKPDNTIRAMLETDDQNTLLVNMEDGDTVHECPNEFDIHINTYDPVTKIVGLKDYAIADTNKKQRIANVANIKVTISTGKIFDGDEKSQDRMLRAINIATITGQVQTEWKMADNSKQIVTLDELKEALSLAGNEMSNIWLN